MRAMVEVSLEMVLKRVEDVLAGQDAIRAELASLNETVRSLARSQVTMQRDIATLKDRVTILTAAVDEHPPAHV
jgi:prefoldin subunit 5